MGWSVKAVESGLDLLHEQRGACSRYLPTIKKMLAVGKLAIMNHLFFLNRSEIIFEMYPDKKIYIRIDLFYTQIQGSGSASE